MAEAETSGVAFRVTGRVQGVAYRWFGRRAAEELGVRGWIRNRADGRVEGEAFAATHRLEAFLERLRQGPARARVNRLDWEPIPDRGEVSGFEIRS